MVIGVVLSGLLAALGATRAQAPQAPLPMAPGNEVALPIAVHTPQDLVFKTEVERQYLIANLMAGGRLGYEAGDFARAVRDWEGLFKIPNLPPEIARAVGPLLAEARQRAGLGPGSVAAAPPPPSAPALPEAPPSTVVAPAGEPPRATSVSGTVHGGGTIGPGGAVLWLKRLDGPTPPPPRRGRQRVVNQLGKTFVPHVLTVGVGDSVSFRNDDPYFHNVFSLSPNQAFDAGLYAEGNSYTRTFTRPGPVELLCNIHASMLAYIYVVDSAYYAQPRADGGFTIRNVPPGRYELHAWHESATAVAKQRITVGPTGAGGIVVRIPSDRAPLIIVPDKYGKPRQAQLGY